MEKTLRVLGGEDEQQHGHSHSHSHSVGNGNGHGSAEDAKGNGHSTAVSASSGANGLTSRGKPEADKHDGSVATGESAPKQTSKLSAYLNLFGDFVHNMLSGSLSLCASSASFAHLVARILVRASSSSSEPTDSRAYPLSPLTHVRVHAH